MFNSGIARVNLYKKHPESLKAVHLLPAAFTTGVAAMLIAAAASMSWLPVAPVAIYALLIGADSAAANKSLKIGVLGVAAAFVQLGGYGMGFIKAWWTRCMMGRDEFSAFEKTFYK